MRIFMRGCLHIYKAGSCWMVKIPSFIMMYIVGPYLAQGYGGESKREHIPRSPVQIPRVQGKLFKLAKSTLLVGRMSLSSNPTEKIAVGNMVKSVRSKEEVESESSKN